MASKLEELRAKLKEKGSGGDFGGGERDQTQFRFWEIPEGGYVTLRYLPNGYEPDNPLFWVEKQMFKWTFADPNKPGEFLEVNVPCVETWDGFKSCSIVNELRQIYKQLESDKKAGKAPDADLKKIADKHWPKKTYLYQGFVRAISKPIETNPPENPIRLFNVNKQLHKIVESSIQSEVPGEMMSELPSDYERGTDFIVKKTKSGDGNFASYTTSKWDRNTSPLSEVELAAIEKFGLFNLKSKLPARPTPEAYAVLGEMFEASVDGLPWNPEWEKFFKAYSPNRRYGSGGDDSGDSVAAGMVKRGEEAAEAVAAKPVNAVLSRLRQSAATIAVAEQEPAQDPVREPDPVEEVRAPESAKEEVTVSKSTSDVLARLKARKTS